MTAPALIVVGSLMMKSAEKIAWDDPLAALPAFLTLVTIPLTLPIPDGITFGFLSCSLLNLFTGRLRQSHTLLHFFSLLLLARWVWL